jgi:16S rRNA C967 or C1407 C5-methylase (RsmB/RsmF family)
VLVYSTCSLNFGQNEGVVGAFLLEEPTARIVPLEPREGLVTEGENDKWWRLTPEVSGTSGMFIAKLFKVL